MIYWHRTVHNTSRKKNIYIFKAKRKSIKAKNKINKNWVECQGIVRKAFFC